MSAAMPHFIKKRSAEFTNARHAGLPSVAFVIAGAKIPEAPIRSVALEQEIQPLVATALMDLTAATVRCRIMDPDENPAVAICTANGYDLSEDIRMGAV